MLYFLWGCRGILTLITLRSERVNSAGLHWVINHYYCRKVMRVTVVNKYNSNNIQFMATLLPTLFVCHILCDRMTHPQISIWVFGGGGGGGRGEVGVYHGIFLNYQLGLGNGWGLKVECTSLITASVLTPSISRVVVFPTHYRERPRKWLHPPWCHISGVIVWSPKLRKYRQLVTFCIRRGKSNQFDFAFVIVGTSIRFSAFSTSRQEVPWLHFLTDIDQCFFGP